MATFKGSSLALSWTTAGATVALEGDFQSCTLNDSVDLAEITAGADTNKTYLTGAKDGDAAVTYYHQGGTTDIGQLLPGQAGTLFIYPEGTASTYPKYTFPALCQGANQSYPYAGAVEINVAFQQNGTRIDGTNS